jgi:hypothetical protein
MRVAIASAARLEGIVRRILARPTFSYATERDESVGAIRGKLDVPRYLRTRLRTESPRRYPIRVVRRRFVTPENVLAAAAIQSVGADLRAAPIRLLPSRAPERTTIARYQASFSLLLRQSNLAEASLAARNIANAGQRRALIDRVRRRISSGHIAKPEPYRDLLDWARNFGDAGAGAVPGDIDWAFYDERFDTKLFELWSLFEFTEALTAKLGAPVLGPLPLFQRDKSAIVTWKGGGSTFRLFFQASFDRAGLGMPRWSFTEPEPRPLGAIPDISLRMDLLGGRILVCLVDPKLRIREAAPTDEIYKLLGYFGNTKSDQPPLGAIIFYSPGSVRTYVLEEPGGGRVTAIGTDPEDAAGVQTAFGTLVDLVLTAASLDPSSFAAGTGTDRNAPEAEELRTAGQQAAAVDAMRRQANLLPPGSLDPFKRSVASLLDTAWDALDEDTRKMVATAEYFGMTAPDDADHSGPLLGLAAACERVIFLRLVDKARRTAPRGFSDVRTLGSIIVAMRDAVSRRPLTEAGKSLAAQIESQHVDRDALRNLLDGLQSMNSRYRIPAAHREVVDQKLWHGGRLAILRPDEGLLPRLLEVLPNP